VSGSLFYPRQQAGWTDSGSKLLAVVHGAMRKSFAETLNEKDAPPFGWLTLGLVPM
jgi:hypothetical protein